MVPRPIRSERISLCIPLDIIYITMKSLSQEFILYHADPYMSTQKGMSF